MSVNEDNVEDRQDKENLSLISNEPQHSEITKDTTCDVKLANFTDLKETRTKQETVIVKSFITRIKKKSLTNRIVHI